MGGGEGNERPQVVANLQAGNPRKAEFWQGCSRQSVSFQPQGTCCRTVIIANGLKMLSVIAAPEPAAKTSSAIRSAATSALISGF